MLTHYAKFSHGQGKRPHKNTSALLQSEFFQFRKLTTLGGDHFASIATIFGQLSIMVTTWLLVKQLPADKLWSSTPNFNLCILLRAKWAISFCWLPPVLTFNCDGDLKKRHSMSA